MTTDNVIELKRPPKASRTQMDTTIVTPALISTWKKNPPFQRPLTINERVRKMVEIIKNQSGIIPGVITLGVIDEGRYAGTYILDGKHRLEALLMTKLPEGLADIRICHFDDLADMGEEFVNLQTPLVIMRPDDKLRGLEGSLDTLQIIHHACPFVGYDQIRRNSTTAAVLSMSVAVRCWAGSGTETPGAQGGAETLARQLTAESAQNLADFLKMAHESWGRDHVYARLWGALNLTMCMWLWRQLVLNRERGVKRYVVLSRDEFKKCLMSLSANENYVDWLLGRRIGERDRAPTYSRIRTIFSKRLSETRQGKIMMPTPAWFHI